MPRTSLRLVWSSTWATSASSADAGLPEPSLYEDVWRLGRAIADTDGLDLGDDDWANICLDWLTRTRPEIYDRGVTEEDVRDAFAAWEIGLRR